MRRKIHTRLTISWLMVFFEKMPARAVGSIRIDAEDRRPPHLALRPIEKIIIWKGVIRLQSVKMGLVVLF
jgi:hypothetical protein